MKVRIVCLDIANNGETVADYVIDNENQTHKRVLGEQLQSALAAHQLVMQFPLVEGLDVDVSSVVRAA